jgi:hypothetical protein
MRYLAVIVTNLRYYRGERNGNTAAQRTGADSNNWPEVSDIAAISCAAEALVKNVCNAALVSSVRPMRIRMISSNCGSSLQ